MNKPAFDPTKPFSAVDTKPPYQEPDNGPDYGQVVKDAVNEAYAGNGSKIRALLTDPITQAKALPYLAGTAGALAPIPFGATVGTVGGRQLSNAALRTYGKPEEIPSTTQQMIEGGTALAGDLTAIPAMTRKIYGSQVGEAESAARVPPPQDIKSTPMALGQKTIGEYINDAIDSVKSSAGKGTPEYWKQIKDQVDRIYNLGKDQGLTSLDQGRLKFLNSAVQNGLNSSVPGRSAPAALLARSQIVPNAISSTVKSLPASYRTGLGIGAGTTTGAGLGYALYKALSGDNR